VVIGLLGACVEPISAPAAARLFWLAGQSVRPGLAIAEHLARPRWAALAVPVPSPVELGLVYGLLVACVLPAGRRRAFAVVALGGLLVDTGWWAAARWGPGELRMTFLDVGQGDAAVAELPDGRVVVVDAGGFPGSDFDTGAAVVAPYLATRKIMGIDALVMTHAHPDHCGGLATLVERYRPREFWWTGRPGHGIAWRRLEDALAETGTAQRILDAGARPDAWAGVMRSCTRPPDGQAGPERQLAHASPGARGSVLLTGDIEATAESRMLDEPEARRRRS
jgi:competence protein ComEC